MPIAVGAAVAGVTLLPVRRPLAAALALGILNALVGCAALAGVEVATPHEFGWFAYSAEDVVVQDPSFPWQYVVVPLALVLVNVLAAPFLLRRASSGMLSW